VPKGVAAPRGGDQRQGVARLERQGLGKATPDDDALPFAEILQGALTQIARDMLDCLEILHPDAAHQNAAAAIL
jgi:hypothetical protein